MTQNKLPAWALRTIPTRAIPYVKFAVKAPREYIVIFDWDTITTRDGFSSVRATTLSGLKGKLEGLRYAD